MELLESTRSAIKTVQELPPFYKRIEFYSVFVALLIGIAGIFREWILDKIFYPKLNLSLKLAPPDSLAIALYRNGVKWLDSYYFRIKVTNSGRRPASDVELLVEKIFKKQGGKLKRITSFVPLKLVWSNTQAQNGLDKLPRIQSNKMYEHCDLGHIEPDSSGSFVFRLDTKVQPTNFCNILSKGHYKLTTVTSANNVSPFRNEWELFFDGNLYNNEKDQFSKGVRIRKLR